LDREALVRRNLRMAEAMQSTSPIHRLRDLLLRAVSRIPVRQQSTISKQRVLLVRPDHLGDVLLTTPAIRALREAMPYAEIHALVGPWSASALANYDDIDVILTLAFPGFARDRKQSLLTPYTLAWKTARKLRAIGYSHAVVFRPDHWWGALLVYLAGIPDRIGFDLPGVTPFLTRRVVHEYGHMIVRNLQLIERGIGGTASQAISYQFAVRDEDRTHIDQYLENVGITTRQRIFCIHPGSGAKIKNWGSTQWAAVADRLTDQLGAIAVITGSKHEMPLVQDIISLMAHPAHNLAGKTGIGQLGALYARSCIVMGPDSGPLHLAAAVGTPTVALFGPADPDQFAPWGPDQQHIVLTSHIKCRPCGILNWHDDNPEFHPCVRDISVQAVCNAAQRAVSAGDS
jgi:lipopolysaccharide heptosyltransferase II